MFTPIPIEIWYGLLRDTLHFCDMKLTLFCVSTTSGLLHDVFQSDYSVTLFSFVVSVGCSVGKLFPPGVTGYFCSTNRCSKAVHNSVMTLMIFVLSDLWDCHNLSRKASSDPIPTRPNLCFKIFQVMVSIGYLIYDTLNQDAPGPGSTALVVLACLAELVVWCWESFTLYKTYDR